MNKNHKVNRIAFLFTILFAITSLISIGFADNLEERRAGLKKSIEESHSGGANQPSSKRQMIEDDGQTSTHGSANLNTMMNHLGTGLNVTAGGYLIKQGQQEQAKENHGAAAFFYAQGALAFAQAANQFATAKESANVAKQSAWKSPEGETMEIKEAVDRYGVPLSLASDPQYIEARETLEGLEKTGYDFKKDGSVGLPNGKTIAAATLASEQAMGAFGIEDLEQNRIKGVLNKINQNALKNIPKAHVPPSFSEGGGSAGSRMNNKPSTLDENYNYGSYLQKKQLREATSTEGLFVVSHQMI